MAHSPFRLPGHLNIRWWIAAFVILVAAGFGFYGMVLYDIEEYGKADYFSAFYHTLQLFVLHAPHLEHTVNWQLHVGRVLAALIFFWAALYGLAVLFRSDLQLRRIRQRGGHVIVCGMGRLGRQLAAEFRAAGTPVIAIEANQDRAATMTHSGTLVLTGDACSEHELLRAGVTRAAQLIAVCEGVQNNVAVVALAGHLLARQPYRSHSPSSLESWLFVADANLRQLFKREGLFPYTGERFRVNVRGLDIFSLAAREALRSNPLDYAQIKSDSPTTVHLVLVGFGTLGQRVALQAARSSHFANRKKLKITILERGGSSRYQKFLRQYPRFADLTDTSVDEFAPDDVDVATKITEVADPRDEIRPASEENRGNSVAETAEPRAEELVTVALCWDWKDDIVLGEEELFGRLERDDATNLQLALNLHSHCTRERRRMPRTLLVQSRASGFAALFKAPSLSQVVGGQLRIVGTIEQTCSRDALMHESTDTVARALHEEWYAEQLREGRKHGDKPALWPWDQIDESYKEGNRQAADHIPVKLRAIGCTIEKLRDDSRRLTRLDGPEYAEWVELLAEMEHARWNAYMLLKGFAPGPRNDNMKSHPRLVPWNELDEAAKEYDRNQVRIIPKALERAGLGIYVP
jgi:voltage-gated potassium channel Kch